MLSSSNQTGDHTNLSAILVSLFTDDQTLTHVDVGPRDALMAGVLLVLTACTFLMLSAAIFFTIGLAYAWFLVKYALTALIKCCLKVVTWLLGATVTSGIVLDMSDTKFMDSLVIHAVLIISIIECCVMLTCITWMTLRHQRLRRVVLMLCCAAVFIYCIASVLQMSGYKVKVKFRD